MSRFCPILSRLILSLEKELDAVIKGSPGTRIALDSPTAVGLRNEKPNKYCGGSNYKGNIKEIKQHRDYGVCFGAGSAQILADSNTKLTNL